MLREIVFRDVNINIVMRVYGTMCGNGKVNTFPQKKKKTKKRNVHAKIEEIFGCGASSAVLAEVV
jgi:hypothetical protein